MSPVKDTAVTNEPRPKPILSIGEVASRTGVAVSALHFYERKGLIASHRSAGNQRQYHRDVIRRVSIIKVAQRLGISLEEVKQAFAQLPEGQQACQQHWQALSANWRHHLDTRIQQLTALRDHLDDCIGCGCLSVERCPLRNPWDALGDEKGAGAHLLE